MRRIRPYRFGSDCEFGFMQMEKLWIYAHHPANEVLRVGNTTTFIGTDGHKQTGEIRPRPAHNIRQHIMDLADAIVTIQKWLKSSSSTKNMWVYALPYFNGETYGGHIHCSFLCDHPLRPKLEKYNLVWRGDRFEGNPQNLSDNAGEELSALANEMLGVEAPSTDEFMSVMNFLIRPFEYAVQPWDLREARNRSYGHDSDCREQHSKAPKFFQKYLYRHFEYRVPSTWLVHPDLAMGYMGLAKLVMLNFSKVINLNATIQRQVFENAGVSQDIFQARYRKLMEANPVITSDLKNLDQTLGKCLNNCSMWFQPYKPIAVDDWTKYSTKGGTA